MKPRPKELRVGVVVAATALGLVFAAFVAATLLKWEENRPPMAGPPPTKIDKQYGRALKLAPLYTLYGCHQNAVFSVRHSSAGDRLLGASLDGRVCLWDLDKKGDPVVFPGVAAKAGHARWGTNEKRIYTTDSKAARVFALESREQEFAFEEHGSRVFEIAIQPKGSLVATGGADGFVRLWEPGEGQKSALRHGKTVLGLAWTPDGGQLASAGIDGRIVLWDVDAGEMAFAIQAHEQPISDIAMDPRGGDIYSASDDRTVARWDLGERRRLAQYEHHTDEVWALAITSNGGLVVSGGKDDTVVWFRPHDEQPIRRQKAHTKGVLDLHFSPDESQLASGGLDGRIRMWSVPGKLWIPELPPADVARQGAPLPSGLSESDAKVVQARRLIDKGSEYRDRLTAAEKLLEEVLERNGKHALARVQLARIEFKRGYLGGQDYRPESLVRTNELLDGALAEDPGLADVYYLRVHVLKAQGKSREEIVAAAEKALELGTGSDQAMLVRGRVALENEFRMDLALEATKAAIDNTDPAIQFLAWQVYGDVASHAYDMDAIEQSYVARMRLDPESAWIRGNYARWVLYFRDDPVRAAALARSALDIYEYPKAKQVLAEALTRQEQKREEERSGK